MKSLPEAEFREAVDGWQAPIDKAILETWGLPEALQQAVEHQDDLEGAGDGAVTLTNILVAAKLLNRDPSLASDTPALSWLNIMKDLDAAAVLTDHDEEIQGLRASLGDLDSHHVEYRSENGIRADRGGRRHTAAPFVAGKERP